MEMKKALILSFHYPPMNVIAARRAESYALFFHQYGIHPTVLTHRWEMVNVKYDEQGQPKKYDWKVWKEKSTIVKEENGTHTVIRVPLYQSKLQKIVSKIQNIRILKKIADLGLWINGHLDINELNTYYSRRKFLLKHLQENKYDVLIGIFSPHADIKLCYEMSRRFIMPFIGDYRDLWDNNLLAGKKYSPTLGRKVFNNLCKFYHKRWLKFSLFFTTVSEPITAKLGELSNVDRGYCITNGFEATLFSKLNKKSNTHFIILHGGTIYEAQDISGFLSGVKLFWSMLSEEERKLVRIVFLAIKSENKMAQITSALPDVPIEFIPRLPRKDAIQMMKDASILFYPSWNQFNGIYSGKLFEYLGVQNNILVIPNDNGVVENLLKTTKSGIAVDDPNEMVEFLFQHFQYWKNNGTVAYHGDTTEIMKYSREYQVGQMANLIHNKVSR